jgi:hypothetical protein
MLERDGKAGRLRSRAMIGKVEAVLDNGIDVSGSALAGALARMQRHVFDDRAFGRTIVIHERDLPTTSMWASTTFRPRARRQPGSSSTGLARTKTSALFDHLVSAGEQSGRHGEAECLGGFEINDQFEFVRLRYWYISRFRPLENLVYVNCRVRRRLARSSAHRAIGVCQ